MFIALVKNLLSLLTVDKRIWFVYIEALLHSGAYTGQQGSTTVDLFNKSSNICTTFSLKHNINLNDG